MVNVQINLYSIDELNKDAKDIAIEQHKDFLLSVYSDDDYDDLFNMTYSKYEKSLSKKYIIEDIKENEYLYFFNGELANITHYCGNMKKAGITELKLFGEAYTIAE